MNLVLQLLSREAGLGCGAGCGGEGCGWGVVESFDRVSFLNLVFELMSREAGLGWDLGLGFPTTVEARKLEHHYPRALKVKYRESQHESSKIHVPTFWGSL